MERCHVIFPGKFKPAHSGHIEMIFKYLESEQYDVDLTVVISKIPKDGLTAETSERFLNRLFIKYPNVHVQVSKNNSPVADVYEMTAQKVFGDGIYAIAASAKGTDMKRTEDYCKLFAAGGKYYTPGIKVISFPIDTDPIHYIGRRGVYASAEISSTILRDDIRKNDYDSFRAGYTQLLESGIVTEQVLKRYFIELGDEILPAEDAKRKRRLTESCHYTVGNPLFEGGAAGHIQHPYEVSGFTFGDLKTLVTDLFHGNIKGMSEKLDGQNLFASVDEYGNTIFARNNGHLTREPWYMKDIENNPRWIDHPNVQHAFTNAAITIDKVFKNLTDPIGFFNDSIGKKWVDLEIIDTVNSNVIPYEKSAVSFHCIKVVTVLMDKLIPTISDDPDNDKDMAELDTAISKTSRIPFEARITKGLDTPKSMPDNSVKYIKELDNIRDEYGFNDDNTILEYKKRSVKRYLHKLRLPFIYVIQDDVLDMLIDRWVGAGKRQRIREICRGIGSDTIDEIIYFDKNEVPQMLGKIMSRFDNLFIRIGNDIILGMTGFINTDRDTITAKLKNNLDTVVNRVREFGDEKSRRRIEKSLHRLSADNMRLTHTEGIVFKYLGHTLKLTGSFAPLNQILGLQNV